MDFFKELLCVLDTAMETPVSYGWFHLLFLGLTVAATAILCALHRDDGGRRAKRVVLIVAIIVTVLEIYKQINFSFSYSGERVEFDYAWYSFPFQFCSTPMYVGLLAGLTKNKRLHQFLCAFLATYAVFGGVCVMVYPTQVFISTIGINIQTMICHGSMIVVGVYLYYSNHVKIEHKTILKATAVFAVLILCAMAMNEIAYVTGLLKTDTFNMFFISPHCDPHLPVYSIVQELVPYPYCLFFYILGFMAAAYIILLVAMLVRKIARIRHEKLRCRIYVEGKRL